MLAALLGAACAGPLPDSSFRTAQRAFTFTIENDAFTGSDNNFTNGLAFNWQPIESEQHARHRLYERWVELFSCLPPLADPKSVVYPSWTLGQQVYTPDDIDARDPSLRDQPYAGVLYLDNTLHAKNARFAHAWNLRIGLVGPSSLAEQVQSNYHELIGSGYPAGWGDQLPDEPILNVDYSVGYDWRSESSSRSAQWRLVPMLGAGLGNYFTGLSSGVYGEYGWNLPASVRLFSLRKGLDSFVDGKSIEQHASSFSLFAGTGGFAVGRYLPLDGTLFRASPSVESEPVVGFLTAGINARWRRWMIAFSMTYFSESFESQRRATDYGTLSIAYLF